MSSFDVEPVQGQRPRPGFPSIFTVATEPARATIEFSLLPWRARALVKEAPKGDGRPVLALPGYGGADGSMAVLRFFLKSVGYNAQALALGRNLDAADDRIRSMDDALRFRRKMVAAITTRVEVLYRDSGEQAVTLIGWSLGGVYAVDVAQAVPDKVRQVITLGSPFGDPRGTTLFHVMRKISGSQVPLEGQDYEGWREGARLKNSGVPITVVYSPKDGIVSTSIASLENDDHVRYRSVNSSHIGFANNPQVLKLVAEAIAASQ